MKTNTSCRLGKIYVPTRKQFLAKQANCKTNIKMVEVPTLCM